ncbi:MAG: hypothetical protein ACK5M8_21970 [Shewanella algae]
MRDYSIVKPSFWLGKTGKSIRGNAEAQVVALYLMTSPHSSMIGVFHCPVMYIAYETGMTKEGALKGLQSLIEAGFCTFDSDSDTVFVVNMLRYQVGENLSQRDNRVKAIKKAYSDLQETPQKQHFAIKYWELLDIQKPEGEITPFKAPSKPLRSQDQDQEQDQDKQHTSQTGNQEEYSTEFEELWSARPRREGADSKKSAFKAYKARIRQGVGHQQLMDGIEAYRRYCEAKGLIGTDKVKMTSTFLGPDEHWKQNYTITSHSVGNVRFTENSDPLGLDDTGWAEGMHILGGDR